MFQDPREKLILSLKKEIKVLRNENHYLRQQVCTLCSHYGKEYIEGEIERVLSVSLLNST